MAHSLSAKKRIRQNVKRAEINRNRISRIRTSIKKVEAAIATGDHKEAMEQLRTAQPEIHRGVAKGVLEKNTAARRISRLNNRVKALAA